MGRNTVTLTTAWQQLAIKQCTLTVQKSGGPILINQTASDVNANQFNPLAAHQFTQNEVKPTFSRAILSTQNIQILVDEVG